MPEQRMVSMKMFLVSIGLLAILNIGMGTVLYLGINDTKAAVNEIASMAGTNGLLLRDIEKDALEFQSEISGALSDLDGDLFPSRSKFLGSVKFEGLVELQEWQKEIGSIVYYIRSDGHP